MYIYKITNIINNKLYIGLTRQSNPIMRWYRHISNARLGIDGSLYNAIRKYGEDKFIFDLLIQTKSEEDLNYFEKYFIEFFKTTNKKFGYNLKTGGANPTLNEESRKKLSNTIKEQFKNGRKSSSPFFKGMIPWNKGTIGVQPPRVIPKEERIAISKRLTGRRLSEETKSKLSVAQSEFQKNNMNKQAKSVICLETNEIFNSAANASRKFNFPITAVARVCNGGRKKYKGFTFKYVEEQRK